jgi:hypothetical protein
MIDLDELYHAVPIGEDNAETSRQIWKRFGLWSLGSIYRGLIRLAAADHIVKVTNPRRDGVVHTFFRRVEG